MTPEEQLRALLAVVEALEICPTCDGPFTVLIVGGVPVAQAHHEPGCSAA